MFETASVQIEFILFLLILALSFSALAQGLVRLTYNRYASRKAESGICADQLARILLDQVGLGREVTVSTTEKLLGDRFDPQAKVLYLSNPMATSVAALAVTTHEVGHALQHEVGYWGLRLRRFVQPAGYVGGSVALLGLLVGWLMQSPMAVVLWGIVYLGAILLMLAALPVELDANRRAVRLLKRGDFLIGHGEIQAAKRVLGAAVMTYVGAAFSPAIHGVVLFWSSFQES